MSQDLLDAIADSLTSTLTPPSALGQVATMRISPAPQTLKLTHSAPATLKLTWLTKDVMFGNDDFVSELRTAPPDLQTLNTLVQGAKPFVILGNLVTPTTVPGAIGQMLVELASGVTTEVPIKANVRWSVLDDVGNPADPATFRSLSQSASEATFLLAPRVVAQSSSPSSFRIRATVYLQATFPGSTTPLMASRTLEHSVSVPAVVLPSVLILCNHGLFDLSQHGGQHPCALVIVPPGVPYTDVANILNLLSTLSQALSVLSPHFTSLPGLGGVAQATASVNKIIAGLTAFTNPNSGAHVIVRPTTGEGELHRIVLYTQFLYSHTAEDVFSSLIFLGHQVKTATFFNARNFSSSEGAFSLTIPANRAAATIETLHTSPPGDDVGGVALIASPAAGSFGDRMSSFSFP